MPRRCSICTHPDHEAIDQALVSATEGLRTIADRWSVSKTALLRHRDTHRHPTSATPQATESSSALAPAPIEAPQPPEAPHTVAECALAVCQLCLPEVQDVLRESAAVLGCPLDQVVRLILDRWGREWLRADTESPGEE